MDSTLLTVVGQPHTPIAAGKGRFQTRLAFFAFERFDERRFFTADIGPRAAMDVYVKIKAGTAGVFAE